MERKMNRAWTISILTLACWAPVILAWYWLA